MLVIAVVLLVVLLVKRSSPAPTVAAATSNTASATSPSAGASQATQAASAPTVARASTSTPATATAAQAGSAAASAINALLDQSVAARAGVQPALNSIGECHASNDDLQALDRAATTRDDLRSRLASVDLAGLPRATLLRSSLAHVFAVSAAADRAYEAWGEDVDGCLDHPDPSDSNKQLGDADSRQATQAKKAFLRVWNPLATRYGYSSRLQADI